MPDIGNLIIESGVAEATFTAGTVTAYGNITARRVH